MGFAELERTLADLADAAPRCESLDDASLTVLTLSQFRRSVTFALDEWRKREAELIEAAGGRVDVGENAQAVARPKMRYRFDHDYIGAKVVERAIRYVDDDGEVVYFDQTPEEAAAAAVGLMRRLYVAPATEPKKSALTEELGFETWKQGLASEEEVGKEVKVYAK